MRKTSVFDVVNNVIFILIAVISVFPIYLIVANAFSTEADILEFGYAVFPLHFTLDAFKYVLKDPSQILHSTWATIVHACGATMISVVIQCMLGYTLTRKEFAFKKLCTVLLLITMFFSAGLIPAYIVRTQIYHLENNWLVYLVPSVSGFAVFVYKSFFNQIPQSLIESAELDGATHLQVLLKISIPLSMTFVATQFFMGMTALWKDYTTTMYYIQDAKMYTLEYYIQLISKDAATMKANLLMMGMSASEIPTETMKFATVLFTLIPMLVIFPLFQKYLSKGLMVGAVKG